MSDKHTAEQYELLAKAIGRDSELQKMLEQAAQMMREREGSGTATYFAADPADGEFRIHDTLESAKADAKKMLGYAQADAVESGWPDETPQICYGVVLGRCVELEGSRQPAPEGSGYEEVVDFRLESFAAPRAAVPDGMVLVPRSAVEWLWRYKPVLCGKAGVPQLVAAPEVPK